MEEKITLAGKEYVCVEIAKRELLYRTITEINKCIADGMPKIIYGGKPYFV